MLQPYNNKWPRLRWLWGLELAGCHACGSHCHVTSLGQCCAPRLRGIHVYPSAFLGRDHTWCTLLLVTLHTNHSPIYTPSQLCSHKDDTVREAASPQYNIFQVCWWIITEGGPRHLPSCWGPTNSGPTTLYHHDTPLRTGGMPSTA